MSDFLNENIPVANPDSNGLCQWMEFKAGGLTNEFTNLTTHRPVNCGGAFYYNEVGVGSASMYAYGNTIPNHVGLSNSVPIPLGAAVIVENDTQLGQPYDVVAVPATQWFGIPSIVPVPYLNCYIRLSLKSSNDGGQGDIINIGISRVGAAPLPADTFQVTVNSADSTDVVFENSFMIENVVAVSDVRLVFENTTFVGRGILVSDLNFVVSYPDS